LEPGTKLSLRQAAEWAGTTKPTVLKHIQAGKVSAEKDEVGRWWLDPSELRRVYGEPGSPAVSGNGSETVPVTTSMHPPLHEETPAQRALVEELRARIAELKEDKDDLRRQVEEERAERARLLKLLDEQALTVRLLTDQRPKEPEPLTADRRPGLLARLLGRS
jgi:hypothetical protein